MLPLEILVGCLFFSIGVTQALPAKRSINSDPQWTKWPSNKIPYYIDKAYTPDQVTRIKAAIAKVSADMSGCITFVETSPTSPEFKIHVTPNREGNAGKESRCFAYPGIFTQYKNAGAKEQRLVLTDGPDGCFSGGKRLLMKYFTVILGKINEHNRADRDQFIKVNRANLIPNSDNIYKEHEEIHSVSTCPYDYCSITHNQPDVYAKQGTDGFIVKQKPFYIPKLTQLSECDCKDLSALYEGCDSAKCPTQNCADLDSAGDDEAAA